MNHSWTRLEKWYQTDLLIYFKNRKGTALVAIETKTFRNTTTRSSSATFRRKKYFRTAESRDSNRTSGKFVLDCQSSRHRLDTSTATESLHRGLRDLSRFGGMYEMLSCSGLSGWSATWLNILSVAANCRTARCSMFAETSNLGLGSPGQEISSSPLICGAETRNYIWRLCLTGVKMMAMTTSLTLIHWPRAHIQRYKDNATCCELSHLPDENRRIVLHDKTWFLTMNPHLLKKIVSRAPAVNQERRVEETVPYRWDAWQIAVQHRQGWCWLQYTAAEYEYAVTRGQKGGKIHRLLRQCQQIIDKISLVN